VSKEAAIVCYGTAVMGSRLMEQFSANRDRKSHVASKADIRRCRQVSGRISLSGTAQRTASLLFMREKQMHRSARSRSQSGSAVRMIKSSSTR